MELVMEMDSDLNGRCISCETKETSLSAAYNGDPAIKETFLDLV